MTTELKPCPLCWSSGIVSSHSGPNSRNEHLDYWMCQCVECGLKLDMIESEEELIALWNARQSSPAGKRLPDLEISGGVEREVSTPIATHWQHLPPAPERE